MMGVSGPGREALTSRPRGCVRGGWGPLILLSGRELGWRSLCSSFSDSSGGHPRAPWPEKPSLSQSQQEQPVLSLTLQADPLLPLLSPALASNRWSRVPANGTVSTPLPRPGFSLLPPTPKLGQL